MTLPKLWMAVCLGMACAIRAQAPPIEDPPEVTPGIEPSSDFFLRGDSNEDRVLNIGDPIHVLGYLFTGSSTPGCLKAADANDDGVLNIGDPVSLLTFLFIGGPDPHSPLNECGVDLTDDTLTCQSFSPCSADTLPVTHWYTVKKNGTACPQEPCFDLTATELGDSGVQVLLTDVNLAHLEGTLPLTQEQLDEMVASLLDGRREVGGYIQDGPVSVGGIGRTLVGRNSRIGNIAKPDLIIPLFALSGSITPAGVGFDVPIRIRVENQGRIPTETSFQVEVKQGTNVLATWSVNPLANGASVTLSKTLRFGNAATGDTIVLKAVADPGEVVNEISEDNNSATRRVEFPANCEIEIINGKPVRICE
jgi:hypothetical protein